MSDPFIAEIVMFGGNFAPRGWAFCDGQLLAISSNTALFSLVGTTFGGDGRTTFGLPEMRGRTPVHVGNGPGLTPVSWGQRGGNNNTTLSTANMPNHTHTLRAFNEEAEVTTPSGNVMAATVGTNFAYANETPDVNMRSDAITSVGGNASFSNMQPFIGIYHIIALVGTFPSRS